MTGRVALLARPAKVRQNEGVPEPKRYLSRAELAERIGVAPDSLRRYRLPEPDALVGEIRGWLPETVDAWNDARPGRGRWKASREALAADATKEVAPGE